jgi:hypothetical protein
MGLSFRGKWADTGGPNEKWRYGKSLVSCRESQSDVRSDKKGKADVEVVAKER